MDKIERLVLDRAKEYYGVDTDEEARNELEEWGDGALHGYGIFCSDLIDAFHIQRLDFLNIYDSDIAAARQAKKDGVKLIPWALQPKDGYYKYFRFVDTEQNREILGLKGV